MKKIMLFALTVVSVGAGVAQAQTYGYERAPAHTRSSSHVQTNTGHSEAEGGG